MITTTLCFLVRDSTVLLAMKKRGFGLGKFNGVGGKLKPGESISKTAIRETEEEIFVRIKESDLKHHATLVFNFDSKPEWNQKCYVFLVNSWEGNPAESEEMKPEWFPIGALPFEQMWIDDSHWLPKVLAGLRLEAEFIFDSEGKIIKSKNVSEVEILSLL